MHTNCYGRSYNLQSHFWYIFVFPVTIGFRHLHLRILADLLKPALRQVLNRL
jgi:hypothetical protein